LRAGDTLFAPGSFDSLTAAALAETIGNALGMQLPASLVFDYPSVDAVIAYVEGLVGASTAGSVSVDTAVWPSTAGHQLQVRGSGPVVRTTTTQ
jgi:Phosphopantetheine attachment site